MSLPNGPKTPAIWQMFQWITNPFSLMRRCTQDYGDCFTVPLGQNLAPMVFFSNPQALQTILTNDDSQIFEAPGELNGLFAPFLGTQSVIGLSGDRHRRMRQLMIPPFHGERMRSYGQVINTITQDVMQQWIVGKSFSVRESMQAISLRVILETVFGLGSGVRYQQLEKLLATMLNQTSDPLSVSFLFLPILRQDLGPLSPWGNFIRKRQQIDQIIYDEIAERRSNPDTERKDILSLLMSARDEAGESMTDVELRDELMTLLIAGHETTATALTWALYWLHKLPEVREKLLQELAEIKETSDSNALLRLPYLNAVCCETLRIYPVGMLTFPRVVKTPVELLGYLLEPGTIVMGCIYLAHHREDVYPDPEQFRPERFLERQFSAFEYLPFGGGSRRCIGMAFAQFEMKVVLSAILSQVELALEKSTGSVQPVRRGLTAGASAFNLVLTSQKKVLKKEF